MDCLSSCLVDSFLVLGFNILYTCLRKRDFKTVDGFKVNCNNGGKNGLKRAFSFASLMISSPEKVDQTCHPRWRSNHHIPFLNFTNLNISLVFHRS